MRMPLVVSRFNSASAEQPAPGIFTSGKPELTVLRNSRFHVAFLFLIVRNTTKQRFLFYKINTATTDTKLNHEISLSKTLKSER